MSHETSTGEAWSGAAPRADALPSPLVPPPRPGDAALPRWVLPVALVGLVVLFVSALPALLARRRIDRESRDLADQVSALERRIEEVHRDKAAIETDSFYRERVLGNLMAPGRSQVAPPPGPPPRPSSPSSAKKR